MSNSMISLTDNAHSRPCPFAFDSDWDEQSSQYAFDSTGHRSVASRVSTARTGGSKESRMKRHAVHDDHSESILVPVRVENIPEKIPHEILKKEFSAFGDICEMKILTHRSGKNRGIGFVKYYTEEAAQTAVARMTGKIYVDYHNYGEKKGLTCTRARQETYFSNNTGALGLTNAPIGEIFEKKTLYVAQSIKLDDCFSRSGYPWGSKHELRRLEPHSPVDINELHSLKLTNLPHHVTAEQIREVFSQYGSIGDIYIPKPLQVVEYVHHSSKSNLGEAFVRYVHKRDLCKVLAAISPPKEGLMIDGEMIKIEHVLPHYWPTKKTRTFF